MQVFLLLVFFLLSCSDNMTVIGGDKNQAVEDLIQEPQTVNSNTNKRGSYTGTTGNGVGGTISNPATFSPGNYPAGGSTGDYSGTPSNPTGF